MDNGRLSQCCEALLFTVLSLLVACQARAEGGCDLRLMVASDGKTEDTVIREFEREFEWKRMECAILVVRAGRDSGKWTISGFSDAGDFRTVELDDPSHELSKELKKEPVNQSRIVELARSSLGRTPEASTLSEQERDVGANFDFSTFDVENVTVEGLGEDINGKRRRIDLSGYIQQEIEYSYQQEEFELSKVRTSVNLVADIDLREDWIAKMDVLAFYDAAYRLEGRGNFLKETLDTYESDFRTREFYVDGDITSWMNIRMGRQYFGWGESDNVNISDIGNSRDLRELGLQNVEEIRLPVSATKLTLYGSAWEWNMTAIHEVRPNELGAKGSKYDPYLALRSEDVVIFNPNEPKSSLSNTQYITRIFLSESWGDTSLFWGDTFDHFPVLDIVDIDAGNQQISFEPIYERGQRYGIFGNVVIGSWLFKYDVARKLDVPLNRSGESIGQQIAENRSPVIAWQRKNVFQGLAGIEYSGISETFISVSVVNQIIEKHEDFLLDDKHSQEISLVLTRDFMNDRITTSLWWNHLVGESTDFFRFDARYEHSDKLEFTFALNGIHSTNEDNYFYDYRKTDRITLGVRYSF